MVDEAIVLAGGLGTRLRSVVAGVPKPMAPIAERPFLEYLLDYWIDQGIKRFTLCVCYLHETISAHFGGCYRGAAIRYAIEETPLGTGGALLHALRSFHITSPLLVLNGDTYFAVDLERLRQFATRNEASVAMALFETGDTARYMGVDVDAQGRILALRAHDRSPHLANGGIYWLDPCGLRELTAIPDRAVSLETELLPLMCAGRRLYGCAFRGTFVDIGVPQDYRAAERLLTSTRESAVHAAHRLHRNLFDPTDAKRQLLADANASKRHFPKSRNKRINTKP